MNPHSPLLLQAQFTVPVAGGSFGLADSTKLENPFQAPMWLDEIRFRLPAAGAVSATLGLNWSSFRIELKLGETTITKGFVHMGLFGKVLNDGIESANFKPQESLSTYQNSPYVFTWRLPKPLFIPAREFLRPTFYFDPVMPNAGLVTNQVVTLIYCCRPLPRGTPTPKTVQIPWVTFYQPVDIDTAAPVDRVDQSTPSDLYNPFDQDMHVQRFVGRLMGREYGENNEYMGLASANVNLTTGIPTTGTFVSAQDSFNNILIRDPTPFAHVFSAVDRAWTVNCVLPPKGFYLFTVDRLWAAFTSSATNVNQFNFNKSVGISMVGWREVQYR